MGLGEVCVVADCVVAPDHLIEKGAIVHQVVLLISYAFICNVQLFPTRLDIQFVLVKV